VVGLNPRMVVLVLQEMMKRAKEMESAMNGSNERVNDKPAAQSKYSKMKNEYEA
jgi:hypothetical protein